MAISSPGCLSSLSTSVHTPFAANLRIQANRKVNELSLPYAPTASTCWCERLVIGTEETPRLRDKSPYSVDGRKVVRVISTVETPSPGSMTVSHTTRLKEERTTRTCSLRKRVAPMLSACAHHPHSDPGTAVMSHPHNPKNRDVARICSLLAQQNSSCRILYKRSGRPSPLLTFSRLLQFTPGFQQRCAPLL